MVLYPHLDPVSLSLQPLLVAFPYQQGPGFLTKPRDCSGGAAVLSTRAPALQVWQILDQASCSGMAIRCRRWRCAWRWRRSTGSSRPSALSMRTDLQLGIPGGRIQLTAESPIRQKTDHKLSGRVHH